MTQRCADTISKMWRGLVIESMDRDEIFFNIRREILYLCVANLPAYLEESPTFHC